MDSLRFLSSCCAAMTGDNVLNVPRDNAMNTNKVIMMTSCDTDTLLSKDN